MISIIICSRYREVPKELNDNILETIGCEHELIFIDNSEKKYSIFSAYNEGVQRAKGDILCFMHEDVLFRSTDWGNRIVQYFNEDGRIGIIGFAGSHFLPAAPMYWYSSPFISQKNLNNDQGVVKEHAHEDWFAGRSIIEVVAVDGFCFFARKSLFEHIRFDETTYSGFHLYDMDICMQVVEAKYKVCVCRDILAEHCWSQKKLFTKEGSDLFIGITGDATANAGHKELQVGMAVCEPDELLDILCDLIQRESHGRNGVAGALESDALSVDGPETLPSKAGGATVMMTG